MPVASEADAEPAQPVIADSLIPDLHDVSPCGAGQMIRRGGSGVFAQQIAAQGESSHFPKKMSDSSLAETFDFSKRSGKRVVRAGHLVDLMSGKFPGFLEYPRDRAFLPECLIPGFLEEFRGEIQRELLFCGHPWSPIRN